jgi:hypothetical protein
MFTAPAPTGALSRRETHEPTGPQTKPFDTVAVSPAEACNPRRLISRTASEGNPPRQPRRTG